MMKMMNNRCELIVVDNRHTHVRIAAALIAMPPNEIAGEAHGINRRVR